MPLLYPLFTVCSAQFGSLVSRMKAYYTVSTKEKGLEMSVAVVA